MNTMQAAVLEPVGEGQIALQWVCVDATLRGLLSEVTVSQSYENLEETNIEAVYTFPLPLDAVLMELTLELNGEVLHGEVKAKSTAEDDYENAIEDGDSAVLLTQVQPGLFTVNVGNLMAGEQAKISFRYAQLHRWQGDSLRFHLPTTLAPRYGDPMAESLREHEIPDHTLNANYGFALNLTIEGQLAAAEVECPSHEVSMNHEEGQLVVTLNGGTRIMDRDFILVVREPEDFASVGLYAPDKKGMVALASFHPNIPEPKEPQPRCIKLVADCSGSMSGDSIYQARSALREILDLLAPSDWFNLTAFGSSHRLLFKEPVPADEIHIRKAIRFLQSMDADMGGTELGRALEATYTCGGPDGMSPDVLLITDGEVWQFDELVQSTKRSKHRLFTVGVGSAVSESLLRSLAENSGGACELVSPNEDMAERIVRHFKRIHQTQVNSSTIHWPADPLRQFPTEIDAMYAGDTLHVFGWLSSIPTGKALLALELQKEIQHESVEFKPMINSDEQPGTLARVAAHSRLPSLDEEEAKELAVEYQLVTSYTSCVLVKQREENEKSEEIPALRKVPHQLAAGWGGVGRAAELPMASMAGADSIELSCAEPMDYLDTPAFLRRQAYSHTVQMDQVTSRLNNSHTPTDSRPLDIDSLSNLKDFGVDPEILEWLSELVEEGYTEEVVTIAWLSVFIDSDKGSAISRHMRRLIHKAEKRLAIGHDLKNRIEVMMEAIV